MFDNFRLIQKALVKKEGMYLVIKRSDYTSHDPFKWDLPGGQIAFGENLSNALEREVKEETSLEVKIDKPLLTNSFMWKSMYVIGIIYNCSYVSGSVSTSHEHTEYKWVGKRDLIALDMVEWIKESLISL